MKRDYSNENALDVKRYLRDAYNNTDRDYRDPYYYQDVPSEYKYLKNYSISAGNDANRHVAGIRDRIDTALSVLSQFYSDVDSTSLQIYSMANNILAILDEVNTSMEEINNILSGLEDYSGKTITPTDIKKAGIDESKCNKLKQNYYKFIFKDSDSITQYIEEMKTLKSNGELLSPEDIVKLKVLYTWFLESGDALSEEELRSFVDVFELLGSKDLTDEMLEAFMENDAAVALYIADMQSLQNRDGSLPPEDQKKLERIYDYYVQNRFDGGDDVTDVPDAVLINCVNTYELLNPDAARIFDEKFGEVYGTDANVDKNIMRIKYTTYTSDPELRDLILKYMDDDELKIVVSSDEDNGGYNAEARTITLNLYNDDSGAKNCYAFFHEFGHFLDSVTGDNGNDSSIVIGETLNEDLRDSLRKTANEYNISLPGDERLTQEAIDDVVNYIVDSTNSANVVRVQGEEPTLPEDWSEDKKKLYFSIRDKYGYQEYDYENYRRVSPVHTPDERNTAYDKGNGEYGIVDDTIGGLTNGKLGGTVSGHAYDIKDGSTKPRSQKKFEEEVRRSYYYYNPSDPKSVDHPMYNPEFFAEVFEYKVIGKDLSATREIFGKSVEQVEGIIKDICERD